ncbi:ceramide synthase-like isoform X2 [Chelonoidis abingdonii]|uniref:ceramide synthase-like isoform X2 n=1 Tax=Chelonoidis abingdonii TaxID=106734 RepID=UPI003F4990EC
MALIFLFSCCFFPLFFLALRWALHCSWALGMDQLQAIYVAAKLVSSIQAIMASTAGYIVFSSCQHVLDDQHWLTSAYTQFAVPYFIYDIYAMFLCHWHKYRVKGHEGAGPRSLRTVTCAFLHKEFLMVLHHLCMVLVCFPVSVVSGAPRSPQGPSIPAGGCTTSAWCWCASPSPCCGARGRAISSWAAC